MDGQPLRDGRHRGDPRARSRAALCDQVRHGVSRPRRRRRRDASAHRRHALLLSGRLGAGGGARDVRGSATERPLRSVAGTLADDFLPAYDVVMRHAVSVAAPAPAVWAALHRADFAGAWYVRALLALRGLRRPAQVHRLTLDRLVAGVFLRLGEREGREVALRLVGCFWVPSGGRAEVRPDPFPGFWGPRKPESVWPLSRLPPGT